MLVSVISICIPIDNCRRGPNFFYKLIDGGGFLNWGQGGDVHIFSVDSIAFSFLQTTRIEKNLRPSIGES